MGSYIPPYTLTDGMLAAAVSIGEKAKRIEQVRAFDARPQLRRNNRIRSIHSSLAIEANSLTMDEVRDVIDGRVVLGPAKEIQEVKNAWAAYGLLGRFDPYSLDELKRLHGIMTHLTVQESGRFRTHGEGVFSGDRCIFMAPPPRLVPGQMASLFDWCIFSRGAGGEINRVRKWGDAGGGKERCRGGARGRQTAGKETGSAPPTGRKGNGSVDHSPSAERGTMPQDRTAGRRDGAS